MTSAERQRRRQEALNAIAQAAGFATWTQLETATINGHVQIIKKERQMFTTADAQARINETPALQPHTAVIMADWPEGAEHWEWVATAPEAEIVDWAETIEAQKAQAETE